MIAPQETAEADVSPPSARVVISSVSIIGLPTGKEA